MRRRGGGRERRNIHTTTQPLITLCFIWNYLFTSNHNGPIYYSNLCKSDSKYVQYNVIVATVQNTSGIPPAQNAPRDPYINWARHGLHTSYYSHHSPPLKINMDQPLEASVPVLPFCMLCSYMYVYRTVGIKVHFVNKWSVSHIRTRTPRLVAHIHVQRTSLHLKCSLHLLKV